MNKEQQEIYQAIFVKKETHQKVKEKAVKNKMTLDQFINFLLTKI